MRKTLPALVITLWTITQSVCAETGTENNQVINPFLSLNIGATYGYNDLLDPYYYSYKIDYEIDYKNTFNFAWSVQAGIKFLGNNYKYHPVLYVDYERFYYGKTNIKKETYINNNNTITENLSTKSDVSFVGLGLDHYIRIGHNDKMFNFNDVDTFINLGLIFGGIDGNCSIKDLNRTQDSSYNAIVFKMGIVNQISQRFGITYDIKYISGINNTAFTIGAMYVF